MKIPNFILIFIVICTNQCSAMLIADNGTTRMVIVIDPRATPTEIYAAHQLATYLKRITGAAFPTITNTQAPSHAILVGPGAAARALFKNVPFSRLGGEEVVMKKNGEHLLLAGGRPRGTLYAVSRFLQEKCGVRWWTPWASRVPKQPTLSIRHLNILEKPAFEYRETSWFTAQYPNWEWRNGINGECSNVRANIPSGKGGHIIYKGFVHTFYKLVPPSKYFKKHPEWFSLINGKRVGTNAQLCLTNPKLREFVVQRVEQWLRESPDAKIVSVSQNDCGNPCECPNCRALDQAQGSHSGTMIAFVNYIAKHIQPEFPNVAVDTLAYQYTEKPPKTLRPRTNVIVRLCSIDCNFRVPMSNSSNEHFANNLRGWAKLTDQLYIWNYVTDFKHYVQPFPNWFTLGPNLRYFHAHHVKGVFEEGGYQSFGSAMGPLRAWVLAELMWNPKQNGRDLVREFLDGYYGKASKSIWQYLNLLYKASYGYDLTCRTPTDAPFLQFKTLAKAERIWQKAEQAVAGNKVLSARVRLGHLAVQYVWLARWDALRKECRDGHAKWPLANSRNKVAKEWLNVTKGIPELPWTKVTLINEHRETPAQFISRLNK